MFPQNSELQRVLLLVLAFLRPLWEPRGVTAVGSICSTRDMTYRKFASGVRLHHKIVSRVRITDEADYE